jgi:hypothetical protein
LLSRGGVQAGGEVRCWRIRADLIADEGNKNTKVPSDLIAGEDAGGESIGFLVKLAEKGGRVGALLVL